MSPTAAGARRRKDPWRRCAVALVTLAAAATIGVGGGTVAAEPPPGEPTPSAGLGPGWFERSGDEAETASRTSSAAVTDVSPGCTFNGSNYWNGPSGNHGGASSRDQIVRRAKSWIDTPGTEYCASRPFPNEYGSYPGTDYGRYRVDCSGYASMAWGLEASYSSASLPSLGVRLGSIDDLKRGDLLIRPGHVVVFLGWTSNKTVLMLAQEAAPPRRAERFTRTKAELDVRYVPYRYADLAP